MISVKRQTVGSASVECSCCGNDRDLVVGLNCHDEIKVCRDCIEWLRRRAGTVDSTPILPVAAMNEAIAFYERAGFSAREHEPGGGYTFVSFDDTSVFDLGEGRNAGCYLIVDDVDAWHARMKAAGTPVTDPENFDYGMREYSFTDPN